MSESVFYRYGLLFSILPALTGVVTIQLCYHYTITVSHHLPEWLWIPVISLLGCTQPERIIYQIGFGLTGLFTLLFYYTYPYTILQYITLNNINNTINNNTNTNNNNNNTNKNDEIKNNKSLLADYKWKLHNSILVCSVGIFGQGIITMEFDAIKYMTNVDVIKSNTIEWKPGMQSIIHQVFALAFFIGSLYHGINCIQLYFNNNINGKYIKNMLFTKYFKLIMLAFPFVFQFISFIYHPISTGNKSKDNLNIAGLTQWLTVFSYLIFFGSYSIDFMIIKSIIKNEKLD